MGSTGAPGTRNRVVARKGIRRRFGPLGPLIALTTVPSAKGTIATAGGLKGIIGALAEGPSAEPVVPATEN